MATPLLAGVVALILDANPGLTVAQIDSILEMTALDLGAAGKDNTYGAGRVDALAAVQAALSLVDVGVFDVSGRRIAIISSEEMAAGTHAYNWMVPQAVGNGIYFVRANVSSGTVTQRMTIVK